MNIKNNNNGFYGLFRPTPPSVYIQSDRIAATFTPLCIQNVQDYKNFSNKTQKRYDIVTQIQPQLQTNLSIFSSHSSTPIHPLHISSTKKTHVRFNQQKNKTIYINGKDFYQQNDIKHKIWWSPQELNLIRNMFMIEVRKTNDQYPHKTPRECILDIFEKL